MSFLAPALLVGLAALAIPMIVHLVQRERRRVVEFPSLMFLRKIPYQSVRRRAIRHWPLLALRVLALIADRVRLRAALPAGRRRSAPPPPAVAATWSSCSTDRSAWGTATAGPARTTRRAVWCAPSARTTGPRWPSSTPMSRWSCSSSAERGALLSAIDARRPTAASTRLGPALRAAGGLLESSECAAARDRA